MKHYPVNIKRNGLTFGSALNYVVTNKGKPCCIRREVWSSDNFIYFDSAIGYLVRSCGEKEWPYFADQQDMLSSDWELYYA